MVLCGSAQQHKSTHVAPFAGNNELDQIQKIHNIIGTPPADLLAKMRKRSAHMNFDFPLKEVSDGQCFHQHKGGVGAGLKWLL